MLSRRRLVRAAAIAAMARPLPGRAAEIAGEGPHVRFGVIADPQYAAAPPRGSRHYAESLWKVAEAVADFNGRDLAFVVTLGDLIDRDWASFGDILPLYDRLTHPHAIVLGNHDYAVEAARLGSVPDLLGLPRTYYDHAGGGCRFLVLDGNEVSLFATAADSEARAMAEARLSRLAAAGAPNAKPWNGGLSEAQFAWIEERMEAAKAAGERVIVHGHYPIHPKDPHNLWDDDRLVALLTGYDNFIAYMNGHNHAGNYGRIGDAHFINFKGMVETPDRTAYAVVEVRDDRLDILGYGLEESRTLAI